MQSIIKTIIKINIPYRQVLFFGIVAMLFFVSVQHAYATRGLVSWDNPPFFSFTPYAEGSPITISGSLHYWSYPPQTGRYSIDGGAWTWCWNFGAGNWGPSFSCSFPAPAEGSHTIALEIVGCTWSTCYIEPAGVRSFTTISKRPTTSTGNATNITPSEGRLNGSVDLKGETAGTAWFRYDTVSTNLNCPANAGGTKTADIPLTTSYASFNTLLSGLPTGVTYYYCAIATNVHGMHAGVVRSFTTGLQPPLVQTVGHTVVDASTATLRARANPQGSEAIGWFRYGTANPGPSCPDTYGTRVPATGGVVLGSGTNMVDYSFPVSGVTLGTRYYYCAFASNSIGTAKGNRLSFVMELSNLLSENLMLASGVLLEGENVRFRATVRNDSTVSTGAGFSNNFSYRWGASGVWTSISTHNEPPMFSGGNRTHTSNTITLSGSGELQVQYCADSASQIGELNETDNCSIRSFTVATNIVIPPWTPPAPELSLSPRVVPEGGTAILTWDTKNGDESLCTLTGGTLSSNPLNPTAGDSSTGSISVEVTARTTYTLTCPQGSDTVTTEIIPRGFET